MTTKRRPANRENKAHLQRELARAHAIFWESPEADSDLIRTYAIVLCGWWKELAFGALICAALVGAISKYYLSRWYTATAIIRPVPQNAIQGQLLGLMSGFGAGGGAMTGLFGGSGAADANEYVAILNSFAFMRNLIRSHHLLPNLLPGFVSSPAQFNASRELQWSAYGQLRERFRSSYSVRTGNITLRYEARSPTSAEQVEGYFIHDLREQLRHRQIRDTVAAIDSLREEAERSADPMIESALYQMIATQIQREKLAEVQADFAFMVLEPPAAPYRHSWPPTMMFCLLAAIGGGGIVSVYVLFLRRPHEHDSTHTDELAAASATLGREATQRASR